MKEEYLCLSSLEKTFGEMVAELTAKYYRPKTWKLNPDKAALLVLDMQNYFLEPSSHAFTPSAPAIITNINMLINMARQKERPVIFTRHVNDVDNAGRMSRWWRDMVAEGSFEAQITETVRREDEKRGSGGAGKWGSGKAGKLGGREAWGHGGEFEDKIIVKNQYDAFFGTDLEEYLRLKKIEQVIISGLLTNLCCETTARSAFVRGFEVFFPIDATAAYNREFHLSAFRNLGFGFCPILTTSELINSLNEPE